MYSIKNEKGFALAMATMVSIALLITFASVYHFLNASGGNNAIIIREDKSVICSNNGVNHAVNILRDQPDLVPDDNWVDLQNPAHTAPRGGPADMEPFLFKTVENNNTVCWTRIRAKQVPPDGVIFENQVFLIESTSWKPMDALDFNADRSPGAHQNQEAGINSAVRVYSWIELTNIANYFAAIKGDLTINAPADLSDARVYGRFITFNGADANNKILLDGADHESGFIPEEGDWWNFVGGPLSNYKVVITNADGDPDDTDEPDEPFAEQGRPNQVLAPLIFPTVNDDYNYYSDLSSGEPVVHLAANHTFTGLVQPPHLQIAGNDEIHHYYLSDGDIFIGDATPSSFVTVQGQVVIVSKTQIIIKNDIFKYNDHGEKTGIKYPAMGWDLFDDAVNEAPIDNNVNESSAHQLVLIAPTIKIDPTWCNYNSANIGTVAEPIVDGSADIMTIQAILVAPNGTLSFNGTDATCDGDSDNHKLSFYGAIWLAAQPTGLGTYFSDDDTGTGGSPARNYTYDPTIKYDPPPLRNAFDIKREVEVLVHEPGVLAQVPFP